MANSTQKISGKGSSGALEPSVFKGLHDVVEGVQVLQDVSGETI